MTDLPPSPPSGEPRPRRWPKILLIVSLGLNLVIFGLIAGAALDQGKNGPGPRASVQDIGLGPYVRALPQEQQRALGRSVLAQARDQGGGPRAFRRELRATFQQVSEELRRTEFDPQRFSDLIFEQSARLESRRALGQQALVDVISEMDAAERAAYADRLEQALRRRGPKKRE